MVHRKGSRCGIQTNHKVRRLPFPYKRICAEQNVVIETKLGAEGHQFKKQAEMHLKRQLEKDSFNAQPDESSKFLKFSLNKAKRWELIDDVKEHGNHHGNYYIIREHRMLQRSSCASCIKVFDSSAEQTLKTPNKKYAKPSDLIQADRSEKVKESDFGKKNCKRSRKIQTCRDEREAESVIQYDVNIATPRDICHTYKSASASGHKHRNSRNRSKKLHQCRTNDVFCDHSWGLSEFSLYDDEEDDVPCRDPMEIKEAMSYEVDLETLVKRGLSGSTVFSGQNERRGSQFKPEKSNKDRVFPIDGEAKKTAINFYRQSKKNPPPVPREGVKKKRQKRAKFQHFLEEPLPVIQEKSTCSFVTSLQADDITDKNLRGQFGDYFIKEQCTPRRFAIDISDRVTQYLASSVGNAELSRHLRETEHHIFTVFQCSSNPWLMMREGSRLQLVESVRLNLCGVDGDKTVAGALTNLQSDNILDVIDAVSQSVAFLPSSSFPIDQEISCQSIKPSFLLDTVQTTLRWCYHSTYANKSVQALQSVTEISGDHSVSQAASNACESCAICYTEFDEDNIGTALSACGHWFCDECWGNHLSTQINQGRINITCPEYKCSTPVDRVTMMSLVPSKLICRHHANQTNSALMLRSDLQWCPSPYCGRLLNLSHNTRVVSISCECGTFWCSGCKQEAHWPATCQQAKIYRDKTRDMFKKKKTSWEDEVVYSVNTKPCPRCRYPIEKWYGCKHMVCKCNCYFCWECGRTSEEFGYSCDCRSKRTWRYKVHHIHEEEIVEPTAVELAMVHHKERTNFACHRRFRKIKKLATQLMQNEKHQSKTEPERKSSVTVVTDELCKLDAIKDFLVNVANFLSEAEFVLEHLEILLSSSSFDGHKRVLSSHKTRLTFLTGRLHKIFREGTNLTIGDIEHLLNCGKDCLRWIALSATQFSERLRSTEE